MRILDSGEWRTRYLQLNGKFKATMTILIIILLGGAYAFLKNERERSKAVRAVIEAKSIADTTVISKVRELINTTVGPLKAQVDSLQKAIRLAHPEESEFLPAPVLLDTTKLYEQKQPEEKK